MSSSLIISMPTGWWVVADAVLDNRSSNERVGGDQAVADLAFNIRAAVWEQLPPTPSAEYGWPPFSEQLPLRLSRQQWEFVADSLRRDFAFQEGWRRPRTEADLEARQRGESALRAIEAAIR